MEREVLYSRLDGLEESSSMVRETIEKVGALGDPLMMENWKRTFPDTEFIDVDESFSGRIIDWDDRSLEERAAYVLYMADPQKAAVKYTLRVEGREIRQVVTDSEKIWWIWESGAFKGLNPQSQFSGNAIKTLFDFSLPDDRGWAEILEEQISSLDVKCLELKLFIGATKIGI